MLFEEGITALAKRSLPLLLRGAGTSLTIAAIAFFIGIMGGCFLGFLNSKHYRKPILSHCIDLYVLCMRGTPITIQALVIFFLPSSFAFHLSPFTAGVITLGLNSVVYVSEIIRGATNALAQGQWDAARILGYGWFSTLRFIIFPQVFHHALPSLVGEGVALIKETGVLLIIGVSELSKVSREMVARELNFTIYFFSALLYLAMTTGLTWLGRKMEKRGRQWSA